MENIQIFPKNSSSRLNKLKWDDTHSITTIALSGNSGNPVTKGVMHSRRIGDVEIRFIDYPDNPEYDTVDIEIISGNDILDEYGIAPEDVEEEYDLLLECYQED